MTRTELGNQDVFLKFSIPLYPNEDKGEDKRNPAFIDDVYDYREAILNCVCNNIKDYDKIAGFEAITNIETQVDETECIFEFDVYFSELHLEVDEYYDVISGFIYEIDMKGLKNDLAKLPKFGRRINLNSVETAICDAESEGLEVE